MTNNLTTMEKLELLKAARGLVEEEYLTTKAKEIMDQALGGPVYNMTGSADKDCNGIFRHAVEEKANRMPTAREIVDAMEADKKQAEK